MKTTDQIQTDALRMHEMKGELRLSLTTKARVEATDAERAAVVRFLRAEQNKFAREAEAAGARGHSGTCDRLTGQASLLGTMAAYIERGDHLTGEDERAWVPLRDLRPGATFESKDGRESVRTDEIAEIAGGYVWCVDLGDGVRVQKSCDVLVREIKA